MSTNLRDLDEMYLAQAFADVGIEVKLNECANPEIKSFIDAIVLLGGQRDKAQAAERASRINSKRELTRAKWLKECAEKDAANYKRRLDELREQYEPKISE